MLITRTPLEGSIRPTLPVRYLLSGGASTRALVPNFGVAPSSFRDHTRAHLARNGAMFAHINVIRR